MPLSASRTLLSLLLAGTALPALAQERAGQPATPAQTRAAQAAPEDDEEIVVTGQKPVGSVVGDIPPEQVLNPADVRAYGVNSISDLLDQLSPQTTSARGRGGEAPVVLLNGRRISGFAEIRDLPTEAILRVEILPEEVALKYGYSADQRVVNFVLRRRFRSQELDAEGGGTTAGGGARGNLEGGIVRIQGDNRMNVDARLQQSDRLLESDRGLVSPGLGGSDLAPYRTLRPRTLTATLNGVYARPLGKSVTATLNATLTATDSDGLSGLPQAGLAVPAGSPFGSATAATTVGRTLGLDPLAQHGSTVTGHLGGGANGMVGTWRWNLTGNYDHAVSRNRNDTGIDTTTLQARLAGLDPAANPNGDLSALLGPLLTNRARLTSDTGNVQLVTNGRLLQLPAGAMNVTVKLGGTFTGLDAHSERLGIVQDGDLSRRAANGQVNVDLPIASRRNDVLPWLGNLTANANLALNQLSDFGTLRTYGFGLNWSPAAPLSLIASYTNDEGAPTVQQLGNPVLLTAQARVFDYLRGRTVDVAAISGGNPALRADDREVWKLGASWKPLTKTDLTLTANYVRSRIRDAIAGLPEPTSDLEAAFPDRFVRDAGGNLIRIDTRPTNFSREREQTIRWGFNLSLPLKPSKASIDAFRKFARERFGQPPGGQPGQSGRPGEGGEQPPRPPEGGPPPGDAPPPPSPGGSGFGGPPGGGGGFGGPPGGGGGGGGFGGGGRGGRFQQNAGGRLQLSIFHTWTLQDDILIRPGVPLLDLLNGAAVGSSGGQPRHQIDAQLGYSNNGLGARLSETFRSATRVDAGVGSTTGDLRFSNLATTDLRLFANVGQMPRFIGKEWARNLRVTFSITNLFDQRQRVRDAMGTVPVRYQGAYLDPAGRGFMIGIRKLFSPLPQRPQGRPGGG